MKLHLGLSTIAIVGLALAGCGGGGSGSTSTDSVNTNQPAVDVVDSGSVQKQIAASTYASPKREVYDYLNAQRLACGFGVLQQSAAIDTAAQAHADYMVVNNVSQTHYENVAQFPEGFTGNTPDARIAAAGYAVASGAGSEVIMGGGGVNSTYNATIGQDAVMDLFSIPYHGFGMLQSDSDVGIGFTQTAEGWRTNINFAFSAQRPKQLLAGNAVATYPCAGSSGLLSQSYSSENPSPIPGRDIGVNRIGTPIYLKVRDGNMLVVSTHDLRRVDENSPVATQLMSKASYDPAALFPDNSIAVVMPLEPLKTNASYVFTATGTNNGQPANVMFTFTTGAF